MSDEHPSPDKPEPDSSASTDDGDSNDSLEPSGGPQRVVSDQSVDDILNSLNETKAAADDSSDSTEETATETEPSVTTSFDEADVPAADDGTADAGDDPASDAATGIDAAATAIPDDTDLDEDASLEELAARIEDGTVTGADVRAAEAGSGRESTPDVDEIELSMDDLEATQAQSTSSNSGGGSATADLGDDAGPLAGSISRDAGDSSENDDEEDSEEAAGLFARIKQFFSG
ncbi:hypothetical protein [Natronorubrum thiooxidans]|uniref:Uncharacterized protein n=1 Tax=Natronorubrum thiooxidans TaxID=308853 RepID=A0A1N7FT37_9EURY|nr:hypothetical protein [Natronorubrum thiooxidans]SIS03434.1 hypothetical protein SAMN05421752_10853 [Natronorubrum thiooxidans]